MLKMNRSVILCGMLVVLLVIIFVKVLLRGDGSMHDCDVLENFESILNKLKKQPKPAKLQKQNKKMTFDDLVKEAEEINPDKYTVSSLKKSFYDYVETFNKDKFKNVSGTTNEALEKFTFFKEQFFEIFK